METRKKEDAPRGGGKVKGCSAVQAVVATGCFFLGRRRLHLADGKKTTQGFVSVACRLVDWKMDCSPGLRDKIDAN